jgi:hypothetical protein
LDRDGKMDLVTASSKSNAASVLLGNGDGSFQTGSSYTTASAPYSVAIGDFNRDGKQDVVTADYGVNSAGILLGDGDGSLQTEITRNTASGPYGVAVADFNHDGRDDIAVACMLYGVSVLPNTTSQ